MFSGINRISLKSLQLEVISCTTNHNYKKMFYSCILFFETFVNTFILGQGDKIRRKYKSIKTLKNSEFSIKFS